MNTFKKNLLRFAILSWIAGFAVGCGTAGSGNGSLGSSPDAEALSDASSTGAEVLQSDSDADLDSGEDAPARESVEASGGCSGALSTESGPMAITVDGLERSYILSLPADYDDQISHPLIFAFHGLGGSGALASSPYYFGFGDSGGTPSILIYPDGLQTPQGGAGWDNLNGRDVALFDAIVAKSQEDFCVDVTRVFATGHSYGGIMANTLGCERAGVVRGIAPVAGLLAGFNSACGGSVASWFAHGNPDTVVAYELGILARDRVLEVNGCALDSAEATAPLEYCVKYDCDAGFPVVWCEHDQNHNWPSFATSSIKSFFDSL
jgi:poly(3-hydroxybutyrate) depolymerase